MISTSVTPGIELRHERGCDGNSKCSCDSYRASVWDKRSNRRIRKTFSGKGALAAAKTWRADATSSLSKGVTVAHSKVTVNGIAQQWLEGAKANPPTVLTRSGAPFKPSALRGYERDLGVYVLPRIGHLKASDVRRGDLQGLVDRYVGEGLSGSKVRNIITSAKTIFRWALERDIVGTNPTVGLRLPKGSKPRDRAASREETTELLDLLPEDVRPIYATAAFAGLRAGELRALRWGDADIEGRRISVSRSWDDREGEIAPKSEAGVRLAPVPDVLAKILSAHKLKAGVRSRDEHFVFGTIHGGPFTPTNIRKRALDAWDKANKDREEPVNHIGLHELRHTAISLWFAAGARRETCEDWAGHSSGRVTDRYRHLRPEVFDAELEIVNEYLRNEVAAESGASGR